MIKVIKNVLTNDKRKKLLEDVQPLLVDGTTLADHYESINRYPGKQTHPTLHLHPDFTSTLNYMTELISKEMGKNFVLKKAWVNWTNGKKEDIGWHHHKMQCEYAVVYYMKTFPLFSNGTLFRDGLVKAPQNSMLVFPAELEHTAPSSPLRFDRYTMAMDLNIIR